MSQKSNNFKEAIKNGREAKLCKDVFIQPKKEAPMATFFERLRWRKILFAGMVLYLSICFMTGCYMIVDLKVQENQLTQSRLEATKQTKEMQQKVAWMKTDEAVETIAREELGMVQPGEVLIAQKDTRS